MSNRKPLMAGNWKMNLNHFEAIALVQKLAFGLDAEDLEAVEVAVLPPFTDIRSVQTLIEGDHYDIAYGAQDISVHASGAYTGEVSGAMLAKLGCTFVAVGHSERRQYHGEDDTRRGREGCRCDRERDRSDRVCGRRARDPTIRRARRLCPRAGSWLAGRDSAISRSPDLVIAYEPVWAIGTGEVATGEDAQEVCAAIRADIAERNAAAGESVRILYGGSVKASNVAQIMAQPDVDGALVGGASA